MEQTNPLTHQRMTTPSPQEAARIVAASRRILATEVERLRCELERRHAEYSKALNKRVDVENALASIGAGKRDLPTREECREWAVKLGNA
jgi:hypothetical protein